MTYEFSLEGKTTLITAAGQGIGRASAEAFAKAGASVIATDINETALAELEGLDGITAWKLDATNPEDIKRVLAEAGRLDVLFNCAGFVHAGNILESTEEDWDFAFDLNAKAMYRLCKAVLPGMLEQGKGSIINMSSVASSLKGVPNRFVYCASKAAVIGMTKAIAADYVTQGIRCNAICPGTVDSPSLHDRLRATGDYEVAHEQFIARQPMGRVGAADEIAALAVYLASDASGFTTGQAHIIDGGWAL
ncbi:MAG: SDR family oxidoreductase [Paracoccaceae bacterium]|jgi:2-keto-3-deoxy-L-fuconate dehydrogenase|uniref:3-hydroxybutyrate dehydrogenase Bdh n=1 Tax=Planktomarina temperata RCA23 TaxID=666509 RepID=A0AAN0RHF1_9RHOB|nr:MULTISPECIES: SDR family oxidoreductase [Paracoccaceae]AII86224.1 3-hydroxybutyrate dehydrogenase Bdh [Planktomarina temperata RCA23]MDG2257467.1 SDR family oxidoreductase [Paracoccaceae bacterium]MDB4170306.1 SDR family oxidoreductase [Planktomarina sp.]MDB4841883.1 SDR family oxidoreductase [Planktomarina sp.]MDU8925908.1 SDR family oxidoreductase [Alisedimentitalea sp. MJ-SS2]|tara:strand:+ start:82 stop:828 length:747 start_codon:yes stop_codon:yes gene_type:complete